MSCRRPLATGCAKYFGGKVPIIRLKAQTPLRREKVRAGGGRCGNGGHPGNPRPIDVARFIDYAGGPFARSFGGPTQSLRLILCQYPHSPAELGQVAWEN